MLRSPMSIDAVPTVPLELVAAFGARKLTATLSAFVPSDRPLTAGCLGCEFVPKCCPSQYVLEGLRGRCPDSFVTSFSFRCGFILRCHIFLRNNVQPIQPIGSRAYSRQPLWDLCSFREKVVPATSRLTCIFIRVTLFVLETA
jgi:hypothetical protein